MAQLNIHENSVVLFGFGDSCTVHLPDTATRAYWQRTRKVPQEVVLTLFHHCAVGIHIIVNDPNFTIYINQKRCLRFYTPIRIPSDAVLTFRMEKSSAEYKLALSPMDFPEQPRRRPIRATDSLQSTENSDDDDDVKEESFDNIYSTSDVSSVVVQGKKRYSWTDDSSSETDVSQDDKKNKFRSHMKFLSLMEYEARSASLTNSSTIDNSLTKSTEDSMLCAAEHIITCTRRHYANVDEGQFTPFTQSEKQQLLNCFKRVCGALTDQLRSTAQPVLHCQSPLFCCGDLHGSYRDLQTILKYTFPHGYSRELEMPSLFIGDYVDRGPYSVQVIMELFSFAVLNPKGIFLLRGNHEDPQVNGDIRLFQEGSFIQQCEEFFGVSPGRDFWRLCNETFKYLPVAAVIDEQVFVCHGGVPLLAGTDTRSVLGIQSDTIQCDPDSDLVQLLCKSNSGFHKNVPGEIVFERFLNNDLGEEDIFFFDSLSPHSQDTPGTAARRQLVRELLWNDPSSATPFFNSNSQFTDNSCPYVTQFDIFGFRYNSRGNYCEGVIREFSKSALEQFLGRFNFKLLIRAHKKSDELYDTRDGRVVTLQSCSNPTCAGACILSRDEVQLVSWYSVNNSKICDEEAERDNRRRLLFSTHSASEYQSLDRSLPAIDPNPTEFG
ncbi:Calcineurin-like phosphoesterase, putative [Angomonas deanei]|uniref:Serine/threonine-protein phosphatase n=1 Tax=Angomonas deanei TaxID=59799 RepID=A0A7G2CM10_9TRYP|nr:Calcineurin-like phosphoesterase, putative [Angomonas deanei]